MRRNNIAAYMAATRRLLSSCMLVVVVALTAPAIALAGSPQGCKLQGSWLGVGDIGGRWISSVHGQNASSGTMGLELPEFDPTLGGIFSTVVSVTTLRGGWERVDGNTFAYTLIGLALDADRNTVWIGKNSGYDTVSDDCNLLTIASTLEVFLADQNPFADAPMAAIPIPVHNAYRMSVDPPAF